MGNPRRSPRDVRAKTLELPVLLESWDVMPSFPIITIQSFPFTPRCFTGTLTIATEREGVVALPGSTTRRTDRVSAVALVFQATGLLASSSETAHFTVLVYGSDDPVDAGIVANLLMSGVDQNDFIVLVCGVLSNPVGVQDAQVTTASSDTFFGQTALAALELEFVDTLTLGLAIDDTLSVVSLAATTANTHAVDDITLLGLIAQASGLIGTRGAGSTMDYWQLTIFPSADSQQETENITLFLLPQFFQVFIGTYKAETLEI